MSYVCTYMTCTVVCSMWHPNRLGKTTSNSLPWSEPGIARYSQSLSPQAFGRYKLHRGQVAHMVSWHSWVHHWNGTWTKGPWSTMPEKYSTTMSTDENSWSSKAVTKRNPTSWHVWWSSLDVRVGYKKQTSRYLQSGGKYHIHLEKKRAFVNCWPGLEKERSRADDIPEPKQKCIPLPVFKLYQTQHKYQETLSLLSVRTNPQSFFFSKHFL